MSLEKAIKYGKEHRKPYYDSRGIDTWCRNHGRCKWCSDNRIYQSKKEKIRTIQLLVELEEY